MVIGERIKKRRIQLGMSVGELAEKIGKNRATVYRYEKGEIKEMPTTVLVSFAKALRTTPAILVGLDWADLSSMEFPKSNMPAKDIIKSRRIEMGLTMKEVAQGVGVSEGTVSRWESGEISNMRIDNAAALSRILLFSPSVLLGQDGSPPEPFHLSPEEKQLVLAYREASDYLKTAACAVLGAKRIPDPDNTAGFLDKCEG